MLSVTRSTTRSWRKSPIRFMKRVFSDQVRVEEQDPSILLREVMRNVAQPVAIAVTCVPSTSPLHGKARYHGATLTSFTSLTLYPHPLVAFSLRLPSRMADCLRPYRTHGDHQQPKQQQQQQHPSSNTNTSQQEAIMNGSLENTPIVKGITLPPKSELPWPLSKLPMPEQPPEWAKSLFAQIPIPNTLGEDISQNPLRSTPSLTSSTPPRQHKTINTSHPTPLTISLLSKSNETMADSLSLPRTDHSSIFNMEDTWTTHNNHPPSLKGSIGSLQCEIVGSVLLKDLCGSAPIDVKGGEGSEMFICRVIGVHISDEKGLEPLLHWRRKYVGIRDEGETSEV
ncbi:hypothetical protein V865_004771 [Kwoniella europaea PYCC6329]|uniref:Flavin reductase like domain-containing protein n=1 Tax=Kwoniella europaea PYCC6329 TaxID=1423913 RepID=A0AAX4KJQ5_9TREE